MKKIISLTLLIAILFEISPIVSANYADNVALTVDKSNVDVGDTVIAILKVSQKVQAVDFSINYSKDIIEFISTSVPTDMYADKGDNVKVSAYSTSGFDTFTFTFKAKAKGNAIFSTNIEALNIDQTDGNTLPFENKTVSITVKEIPTTVEVTSVTLDKTTASVEVGKATTLTATVAPTDATNKTITWTSSDTSIATVSNGTVTGVKAGTATITAKAGTKSATCTVTVTAVSSGDTTDDEDKKVEVISITLNKNTEILKVGETLSLTATVKPDNAKDKTVTWKSSDTSIATVTNGVVKAIKEGKVTITASAGDKSATCKITVTNKTDSNNNNNNSNTNTNKDNTTATKPIPQTGETLTVAGIIIATISIAIISIIKYRRYKDI